MDAWITMLAAAGEATQRLYVWLAVIVGLIFVGGGIIAIARKKTQAGADADSDGPAFSLADLRAMHASGQLSDEEFAVLKQKIVGQTQRIAERPKPPRTAADEPGADAAPDTHDTGEDQG